MRRKWFLAIAAWPATVAIAYAGYRFAQLRADAEAVLPGRGSGFALVTTINQTANLLYFLGPATAGLLILLRHVSENRRVFPRRAMLAASVLCGVIALFGIAFTVEDASRAHSDDPRASYITDLGDTTVRP